MLKVAACSLYQAVKGLRLESRMRPGACWLQVGASPGNHTMACGAHAQFEACSGILAGLHQLSHAAPLAAITLSLSPLCVSTLG